MQAAVLAGTRKVSPMIIKHGFADESIAFAIASGLVEFTEANTDRNAERRAARMRRERRKSRAH
jgi:hypothetical protein